MPHQLLHMSEGTVSGAALAVRDAINLVRRYSIEELESRGKIATGRTISTLATSVTVSGSSVTGALTGEEQWKYVGNGRRPGKMPPIGPIQEWVDARGLTISPWAVAKGIALRGTKDWREKRTNVFVEAFKRFEQEGGEKEVENRVGQVYEQQAIELAIKYFK